MTVDPRRLLVFSAIVSNRSITAAGKALHVSASAVSQHLAALEREAGVTLVDRTPTGVVLTPAGRALARRAVQVQQALTAAENDIAELTGRVAGVVTVATYATIANRIVAPAVAAMETAHPEISARILIESDQTTLLRRLTSGAADVVLSEQYIDASGALQPRIERPTMGPNEIVSATILDDEYHVVIPASWTESMPIDELLSRPWISGPAGTTVRLALDGLFAAAGLETRVEHECCEFPGTLDMVAGGLGAAIVPQLALSTLPAGVALTDIPVGLRRIHSLRLGRPTRDRAIVRAVVTSLVKSRGLTSSA